MSYLICTKYTDIYGCISPVSKDLLGLIVYLQQLFLNLIRFSEDRSKVEARQEDRGQPDVRESSGNGTDRPPHPRHDQGREGEEVPQSSPGGARLTI